MVFSSALPEVPAAIGAVVVMSPVSVTAPADIVPVVPLTIPWLAVPEGGSWLPTATTTSPTWTVPESANVAAASPVAPLTRMTATSLAGSDPLTVPAYRWPAAVVIVTGCAPATRLAGVTMVPAASRSKPDPVAEAVSTRTTDGPAWAMSRRRSA